ncbi:MULTISPECIES: ATP-dependent helicase HrpB [Arthrobacter]|uniref:ATP-dependent helicase HrpB n=2 Tax=Arthrobacter TaxID=1663 RepID=A0ABU9KKD7_9MICC|nr:ATP-dependent helicase HrpB [Arthrobacter sp. YJM1]MDP5226721.1 ATP-dependent helicase HrpB [Arthrobacter sp. YJM1]
MFELDVIGAGLPFAAALPELRAALSTGPADGGGPAAVVQAPPGTGKTTLVPPLVAPLVANLAVADLADENDDARPPRVVVTQPRRVAARAAAQRLAALDGSPLGTRSGFTVRGERQAGRDTVVEFVTPGILLRRLLKDPELSGVDAVILDEVHERALESDLLFSMLAELRQLREDLRVVAMSATLDAARFATLLGGDAGPVPVIDCPSALHPLEKAWAPSPVPRLDERGVTRGFLDHVADTAAAEHRALLDAGRDVDALVFVPGAREVRHVAERLRSRGYGTTVLELHGQVPPAEQLRAVSGRGPGEGPRVVVSTSLAESSLTVPGVRLVIDSCLSREPRRDAARGMNGLVTVAASRASAEQRAGRAARQGPGRAVRCCDERTFAVAPAQPTPEIQTADLTEAALVLACWGSLPSVLADDGATALPDAPPAAALKDAVGALRALGAIDVAGRPTTEGRLLAAIPADPRLGRALLEGAALLGPRAAAEAVALVAREFRAPGADLGRLLSGLRSGSEPHTHAWKDEARRFERLASAGVSGGVFAADAEVPRGEEVGAVVALAFPAQVARRVPGDAPVYLLASGTRAALPSGSGLAGQEWLAVAEAGRAQGREAAGTGAVIRAAAVLSEETALFAAGHLLADAVEAAFDAGRVTARKIRRLGAIVLASTPVKPSVEEGRAAVLAGLRAEGLGVLTFSPGAEALRRRLGLLHRVLGEPWPDVSDTALLDRAEEWLGPELEALAGGKAVKNVELLDPLRRLLPWPEAVRLDELAPAELLVPSGRGVRIEYPPVESEVSGAAASSTEAAADGGTDDGAGRPAVVEQPVIAVKLQECFGWAETPRLLDGRVPVLFHLLSPAGRPLAVTGDLASFWSGPYAQVRAEMRGRYPKHPWPEDPWTAVATAKTKNRMG